MPYYRGDNYGAGDYYQGDFLGIGGFAKRAFNVVKGATIGALTGNPLAVVGGAVKGALQPVGQGAHPNLPQPKIAAIAPPVTQTGLVNIGSGSQSGLFNIGTGGGGGPVTPAFVGPMARGMHLNKSTYETRGGGTSRWGSPGLQLHAKGTVLVRNRRMNVGNARALKKSLRRISGFARLARRVMTFTHPKAGRGKFKFAKRARR